MCSASKLSAEGKHLHKIQKFIGLIYFMEKLSNSNESLAMKCLRNTDSAKTLI